MPLRRDSKEVIRLGILAHGLNFGGAGTSLYLLIKSIYRKNIQIYLYVPQIQSNEILNLVEGMGVTVRYVELKQLRNCQTDKSSMFDIIKALLYPSNKFIEDIKADRINVLHINTSVYSHVLATIKKSLRIKIITHVRELIPNYGLGLLRNYVINNIRKYSDVIVAISNNEATAFQGHPRLCCMANPYDFDGIKNLHTEAVSNSKTNGLITVGMMGQFSRSKGHLEFLEMVKYITDKNKNYAFKILGVKDLDESRFYKPIRFLLNKKRLDQQVYEFIEINKLHDYVKLVPWKNNVNNEILDIDIMVRPSLSMDPWGRDVIESMALSKPIVAYGTSEFFIKNNKTGILVKKLDYRDLAEAVMDLGANRDLMQRMGANGREVIESMCNIDKYGQALFNIYNSLLRNNENGFDN